MYKLSTFLFIAVCATPGVGQTMFGHADTTCIDFLSKHDKDGEQPAVRDWLEGYFSGRVRETNRDLTIVNNLQLPIYDLLHKVCSEDPNIPLNQAADKVYASIP